MGRHSSERAFPCLLACFCVLSGCMPSTEIRQFQTLQPITPQGESRSIMFKKLISKMNRGQEIGTVQVGLACVARGKIFWKRGGQYQVGDEELIDTLKEELTKAGYSVVGDPNSLFEDPKEWKAELLLAGVIKHVATNRCFPMAGFADYTNSSGEASIEVEWQLFERRTRSVVYTATTGGTASTDEGPARGEQAYYDAFGAAVRNLLGDKQFAVLLSRSQGKPMADQPTLKLDLLSLEKAEESKASEVVQYVHGAVVTIPVGTGHGSGVIISTDGMVITNAHVVGEGSGMISVELSTGRRIAGEVVRSNKDIDVALIRLEKGQYLSAPVASSNSLKVGDPVYAIGTPFDERFSRTVTKGIVSSFREENGKRLIQSDVSIHPGNSGGPLLDRIGRVVGLTQSGMMIGGEVGVGLNYFVPIDELWKALKVEPNLAPVDLKQLLAGSPPRLPSPTALGSSGSTVISEKEIADRLKIIRGLKEKNLISQEEADRRAKEVLDRALK